MTHASELTPEEFLALQQLRLAETAEIHEPSVVTSLEDKGFIARTEGGWALTDLGEARYREQTGDDAKQR